MRFALISPKRPFAKFTKRIFLLSIMSRKSNEDFSCAINGRITSFARKTSNLLVMYGTMFASAASPPAFSATSVQNCTTIGFLHREIFKSRNFLSAITRDTSRSVEPVSGSSITSMVALRKYCSNIGPIDSGTAP